jgi:hypothetical protein
MACQVVAQICRAIRGYYVQVYVVGGIGWCVSGWVGDNIMTGAFGVVGRRQVEDMSRRVSE